MRERYNNQTKHLKETNGKGLQFQTLARWWNVHRGQYFIEEGRPIKKEDFSKEQVAAALENMIIIGKILNKRAENPNTNSKRQKESRKTRIKKAKDYLRT